MPGNWTRSSRMRETISSHYSMSAFCARLTALCEGARRLLSACVLCKWVQSNVKVLEVPHCVNALCFTRRIESLVSAVRSNQWETSEITCDRAAEKRKRWNVWCCLLSGWWLACFNWRNGNMNRGTRKYATISMKTKSSDFGISLLSIQFECISCWVMKNEIHCVALWLHELIDFAAEASIAPECNERIFLPFQFIHFWRIFANTWQAQRVYAFITIAVAASPS